MATNCCLSVDNPLSENKLFLTLLGHPTQSSDLKFLRLRKLVLIMQSFPMHSTVDYVINKFHKRIFPFINTCPNLRCPFYIKCLFILSFFYTPVFDGMYYGIALSVCSSVCLSRPCRPRSRSYCHIVGKHCRLWIQNEP